LQVPVRSSSAGGLPIIDRLKAAAGRIARKKQGLAITDGDAIEQRPLPAGRVIHHRQQLARNRRSGRQHDVSGGTAG
jgi:hypothetical protein